MTESTMSASLRFDSRRTSSLRQFSPKRIAKMKLFKTNSVSKCSVTLFPIGGGFSSMIMTTHLDFQNFFIIIKICYHSTWCYRPILFCQDL